LNRREKTPAEWLHGVRVSPRDALLFFFLLLPAPDPLRGYRSFFCLSSPLASDEDGSLIEFVYPAPSFFFSILQSATQTLSSSPSGVVLGLEIEFSPHRKHFFRLVRPCTAIRFSPPQSALTPTDFQRRERWSPQKKFTRRSKPFSPPLTHPFFFFFFFSGFSFAALCLV